MSGNSWVTLATNDSYSLGALVLAYSLKRVGTKASLTVMVTPGVSSAMRNQLASVFNVIEEVNILDSKDEKNLALLTRPELGITFTKLHCWRLTQFSKCVFLDADVLVLQNCDELFAREELSAAPDVGWPDCFNSGVYVYSPSIETYNALVNFALSHGSFDGGDQGLLNQFFSDWSTKDISRHLPFIYNMCSSATYSYLPAFKQFGQNVKIVHFIGSAKPWLQYLDSETRQVRPSLGSENVQGFLQLWWDIFCNDIHSTLSSEMVGLAGALSQLTLGTPRSPEQIALEEHLRKQSWEQGNIDYMGRDSFDNIWRKICQTLSEAPSDPLPEQNQSASQVSSVEPGTQCVSPAGDTLHSLQEPFPVAAAHTESTRDTVSSSGVFTESISSNSVPVLNSKEPSSTSPEVQTISVLPCIGNVRDLTASPLTQVSSDPVDSSVESGRGSLIKETECSSLIRSELPQKIVGPKVSDETIRTGLEESQKPNADSSSSCNVESENKIGLSEKLVLVSELDNPLTRVQTEKSSSGEGSTKITVATPQLGSVDEFDLSTEPKNMCSSEATLISPLDSPPISLAPIVSQSQTALQSPPVNVCTGVGTLLMQLTPITESLSVESNSTVVQQSSNPIEFDTESSATEPSVDLHKTVSPSLPSLDRPQLAAEASSFTSPVEASSILRTPIPVGAEEAEEAQANTVAPQSPSPSEPLDPQAPIPPKRRHRPSQNPDQLSAKSGKSPNKPSKGKK